VIRIQQVDKTYRTRTGEFQALHGIDLDVSKGEVFGIIGRSGAGKSSLLRLINLLERPTAGRIFIEDDDVTHLDGEPLRRLRQQYRRYESNEVEHDLAELRSRSVEPGIRCVKRMFDDDDVDVTDQRNRNRGGGRADAG